MTKLLFVCLGNICRSPAAEAIFKNIVSRANLSEKYIVDSAGTSGYHNGNSADARMTKHAQRRGYKITSKSRAVKDKDFQDTFRKSYAFHCLIGITICLIVRILANTTRL